MEEKKYTLMEVLIGNDDGAHVIHPMQKHIVSDDATEEVRDILGSKDKYIAKVLSTIALSHHCTHFNLNASLIPVKEEEVYHDLLVSDMNGMCLFPPAELDNALPTLLQRLIVQYSKGARNCLLIFRGKEWNVGCHYGDNRLFIDWPKEFGIRGALDIEDYSQNIYLPLRMRYPIASVVQKLKLNTSALNILERTDLFHEFFFSDTDDEAIGIMVLALYIYLNDVISSTRDKV